MLYKADKEAQTSGRPDISGQTDNSRDTPDRQRYVCLYNGCPPAKGMPHPFA
jgi:hypothetical protein